MNQQLQNLLLEYLGELMVESESYPDWIEGDKIRRKINAINTLIGTPETEETFRDTLLKVNKLK